MRERFQKTNVIRPGSFWGSFCALRKKKKAQLYDVTKWISAIDNPPSLEETVREMQVELDAAMRDDEKRLLKLTREFDEDGDGVWDHDYALAFMRRNVNMSDEFIQFEVNRYLGWPGQAPSYKVGQRIWEQLRDTVAEQQGDAFDIKAFHKRALDIGGVGLDTLRAALLT